jgi:hypothetical protein
LWRCFVSCLLVPFGLLLFSKDHVPTGSALSHADVGLISLWGRLI